VVRTTIDDLLDEARRGLVRLEPAEAAEAALTGALLVDVRSADERRLRGVVPGSLHLPLSVLPWRCDPDSAHRNPAVPGLDGRLVLFCADGYSSSLAAASLQRIGFARATDMVGGFTAWRAAGLPTVPAPSGHTDGPLGMGPPEPG
jgi:rhodanese-related sulfurtransferase